MAWITPVADRGPGAMHTLDDQNRITNNINWLTTNARAKQLYTGANLQKVTYVHNDYITTANWADIINVIKALTTQLNVKQTGAISNDMTYSNMNTVESMILAIYEKYQQATKQSANNHYTNDNIYAEADKSIYSAGLAE